MSALATMQGDAPLLHPTWTPGAVAAVVADWTGIPVGSMVKDEIAATLAMEDRLRERVVGQDHALKIIAEKLRTSRAGFGNPDQPMGVFLCVGPSGVGKTELALAVADLLFGGERFLTSINMSEFMEAHTVSQLKGSPPGYVGYGEGGVLTEAVRQHPYSVVLLDEVEKAHPDVMNLFYQVFDKGSARRRRGPGGQLQEHGDHPDQQPGHRRDPGACANRARRSTADDLKEAIYPHLREHFKPALVARMTVIPFLTLGAGGSQEHRPDEAPQGRQSAGGMRPQDGFEVDDAVYARWPSAAARWTSEPADRSRDRPGGAAGPVPAGAGAARTDERCRRDPDGSEQRRASSRTSSA
jgi:type VI secretion system protein VasG